MGYFRRFKPNDHTAAQCKAKMKQLVEELVCELGGSGDQKFVERYMDEWACYRELLARHENQNKSKLDK